MTTRYWLGAAVAVPQTTYAVVTAPFVAGETITLSSPSSGNTKDLILTIGTTITVDQILADLVDMVNGASINNDETRSAIGSDVGEWADITATADTTNDYLILTGASDGRPFTATFATDSVAGTIATPGSDPSTAAQSPHDFDNADNWSGSTVPVTADDIVFDRQASAGLKYSTSQTGVKPTTVQVTSGYRYGIGLPSVAGSSSLGYNEYLNQYLKFGLLTAMTVTIDASSANSIRIDTNTQAADVVVSGGGSSDEAGVPSVLLRGNSGSSTYSITDGNVGLCYESGQAGNASAIQVAGSAVVEIGDNVTLTSCTLTTSGGKLITKSTISTTVSNGGTIESLLAAALTTLTVNAGTYIPKSVPAAGAIVTTLIVGSKGTVDCTADLRAKTFTNVSMYPGAKFNDPSGVATATNGFDIYGYLSEVSLVQPPRKTYSISAI